MVLALEPFLENRLQLKYHIASVQMQSLWIVALWLMLRSLRISRLTIALVILTISFFGFAIVNSFYVWPKLWAAAYTMASAIPLLALRSKTGRPS